MLILSSKPSENIKEYYQKARDYPGRGGPCTEPRAEDKGAVVEPENEHKKRQGVKLVGKGVGKWEEDTSRGGREIFRLLLARGREAGRSVSQALRALGPSA